ncbi:hypothetical protein [Natrinema salaciae]|uniref:RelE toxin-related domain-containing protein n=1 Tax=Natrinema salaciae TaxID=1186196 RepID=A0A1H9ES15_9EURY|nr:hypothetical protein [Natrinema salaciae]SEQ28405.1 hypothetical protein SAMN04489841_1366 [Natrinema salaciae]
MSVVETNVDVTATPRYEEIVVDEHFPSRWAERSDRPQLNPKIAWLEAITIDYPSAKPPAECTRYHEVTGMLLLAEPNGRLVTCIPLEDRPRDEQQYIRFQASEL